MAFQAPFRAKLQAMKPETSQLAPQEAVRQGWRALLSAGPRVQGALAGLFLLALAMLPVGRAGPDDGGGVLAPLTADSGYVFRTRPAADFFSVYDAGARVLRFEDPYGVNEDTGEEGVRAPYVATFRYLPITAVWLAVPLNVLPPWPAFSAWVALNFVLLIFNFLLCAGRNPRRLLLFGVIWLAWFPLIAEWHMGQFTFFMSSLMLWGFDAMWSGHRCGALGWLFAALLKVYPIAMAPSLWLWGRRWIVVWALLLAFGTTAAWRLAMDSGFDEGMVRRGVAGRLIGETRLPYAGAVGTQEMVNAVVWEVSGRSFNPEGRRGLPDSWAGDPVFWLNGLVLAAYTALCLWALWKTRRYPSLAAIGLFWMAWFVAYSDAWEHHYVLIQGLLGLLLAWRVIDWRVALACWAFAGGPSLWWPWFRSGYHGDFLSESLGLLYFLQRPLAVILLAAVLVRLIAKNREQPNA